jgi:hypothetical protein
MTGHVSSLVGAVCLGRKFERDYRYAEGRGTRRLDI